MEKSSEPYFFEPRYSPEGYSRGWEGYRTLVLGVFHVCTASGCPHRADCLENSRPFDSSCPVYAGRESCYRLSNSNEIEVESYLEGEVNHPTYSSVTKYLLRTNRHLPEDEKRRLWGSIAFTNFLQNFRGDYDTLSYWKDAELLDAALPPFKTVLDELRPEVLYVIDTAVSDCLRTHAADIPGLKFIDENQDWTLPMHRFTLNPEPKASPERILDDLKAFDGIKDGCARLQKILKCLQTGRGRSRIRDSRTEEVLPHIWDSAFESHIYRKLLDASLSAGASARLTRILQGLHSQGYTTSHDKIVFRENTPRFNAQYQRDGIIVEIAGILSSSGDSSSEIKPYEFARAMDYCRIGRERWRTERMKEYSLRRDVCRPAILSFISELGK